MKPPVEPVVQPMAMTPGASARSFGRLQVIRSSLVAVHILFFFVLSYHAFGRNLDKLFVGIDGAYMLTLAAHLFVWTPAAAGFFVDPFQGLGDVWFNLNAWLIPGYLVPHLLLGQGNEFGAPFRVLAYAVFALELFLSTLFLARSIGLGWVAAVLGAWSMPLLAMPYFGSTYTLLYPIFELTPQIATATSEAFLLVGMISRIGRKRGSLWHHCILFLGIAGLSGHFVLAYPTVTLLAAPFLAFTGLGFVIGGIEWREIKIKIIAIGSVLIFLLAAGFAEFVLGIFSYSASVFWGSDFEGLRQYWYFGSILFHGEALFGPAGRILFLCGVAGLTLAAVSTDRRLRSLSLAYLALVAFILLAATANALMDLWPGPAPLYFELMMWPIYAIFAARLVTSAVSGGWRLCTSRITRVPLVSHWVAGWETACILPLAAITAMIVQSFPERSAGPGIWPAPGASRPIVKALQEAIGISPGDPFRGRVLTLQALGKAESVVWYDFVALDTKRAQAAGNDYHHIGLWTNGIPTVLEYNSTMSPAFFRLATRLLARPGDKQARSVLVLRQANARILGLLGVRYVIADEPLPLQLVLSESTGNDETLRLYEVPNVNQGTYSPLELRTVRSFEEAIVWLDDPAHDLTRTAVIIGDQGRELTTTPLTSVTASSIHMIPGGMIIEATAPGTALLVVPFEFSHCLDLRTRRPSLIPPRVLRVDAIEIGILFTGQLDVEVSYFTGPFDRSGCRVRDAREFRRLLVPPPK
ncbi:MAG: hypothetical protein EXR07_16900 [Acetobacteraceae bacterium]|nr:hypothetical protein [Acetobacteraceae bacterium]